MSAEHSQEAPFDFSRVYAQTLRYISANMQRLVDPQETWNRPDAVYKSWFTEENTEIIDTTVSLENGYTVSARIELDRATDEVTKGGLEIAVASSGEIPSIKLPFGTNFVVDQRSAHAGLDNRFPQIQRRLNATDNRIVHDGLAGFVKEIKQDLGIRGTARARGQNPVRI